MKKLLAVLLTLVMALGMFASVGYAEAAEPVELNIITTFAETEDEFYETPVYKEFVKQSGVKLTSTYVSTDKFNVILAGGDTTDLVAASYSNYYQSMAEGGLIVRINDMLEGATFLNTPDRDVEWNLLKSIYDGGDGSIYGVLNSIGAQGGNAQPTNHGTYVNWEYYKEIGAPELEDYYDFIDALADFPELEFDRCPTSRHNYHLLAARLDNGHRDAFIRSMFRDKGVRCVVQYLPLNRYDFYRKLGYGKADCPNADAFYDAMVSFPFQHWLSDEDCAYMLEASRDVLARLRS